MTAWSLISHNVSPVQLEVLGMGGEGGVMVEDNDDPPLEYIGNFTYLLQSATPLSSYVRLCLNTLYTNGREFILAYPLELPHTVTPWIW